MSETFTLTCELIRCPSITPDDAGCMDVVQRRLVPAGFVAERLDVGNTANLWLRHGKTEPLCVFLGHTDVVPPGHEEEWDTPPFEPTIRDNVLYGRGAADMKSGVAAMTTALQRFVARYPDHPGSVGLLLTSDEEGKATEGIVKVVEVFEARNEKIAWCVIGEPSSFDRLGDVIRVGRRGSLCAVLTVFGVQGHIAYPDKADNPIHRFLPVLMELCAEEWDQGNEFFPPTSFQVSNIQAGTGAENVIPGRLKVWCNFRYSTASTAESLQQRFEAILDRHALRYQITWHLSGPPFLTARRELIEACQNALQEVVGHHARLDTGGGTSDGRFIAPTGAQIVEIGSLNHTIHQVNECVPVADLDTLSAIYERIAVRLLSSYPPSEYPYAE